MLCGLTESTLKEPLECHHSSWYMDIEMVFPASLGVPVMKLLQEQQDQPYHLQRRINQIIEINEVRDRAYDKIQLHQ